MKCRQDGIAAMTVAINSCYVRVDGSTYCGRGHILYMRECPCHLHGSKQRIRSSMVPRRCYAVLAKSSAGMRVTAKSCERQPYTIKCKRWERQPKRIGRHLRRDGNDRGFQYTWNERETRDTHSWHSLGLYFSCVNIRVSGTGCH